MRISQLQSQLFKDQSEQNYLQFSGLSAVKAVLEERHNLGKVYGLVAELGEVDEEHRLALEVAAAAHLSSVVVENEEVAKSHYCICANNVWAWLPFCLYPKSGPEKIIWTNRF